MKKIIKINFIVLIFFIIINMISTIVFASNISEENDSNNADFESEQKTEDKNLDSLKTEKNELESNLEKTNNQMQLVESELSDLLIKVEEISLDIIQKNQEIDKLTIENESLKNYIKNVQTDLEEITNDYNNKKKLLEQRLVASYKMGKTSYLDMLLKSKDIISFISNYYLFSEIVKKDEKLVEDINRAMVYMENLNQTLIEKKYILEQNKIEIQKQKISLENMQALKSKKVDELSETEKNLHSQIEDYQTQIESVEREIRLLSISNISSQYIGGNMAWPVPGYTRITSPFGMRTHPITGIYKLHTGTDIGAPYGATFIAANDGVVVKAEYNNAYGNMVIIDHGGGITTLYAHGSEILVNVGEVVSRGTPVLKVGSTGYSTGPHAHFEVRINGEYKNPLEYITSNNKVKNEKESEEVVIN